MLLPPNKKVAEGLAKNTFNSLRGIKDWRTDDVNGDRNDLPALSKGLSAAMQNHADQVGVFLTMKTNSARALTYGDRLTSSFLAKR